MEIELDFSKKPPVKCRHCGRSKGNHQAVTFNCPIGRGNFPQFHSNQFFEPRKQRKTTEQMTTEQMTTEQMTTELSREQFIKKYGDIKVKFSSYYKFTFVFAGRLDNGDYIRVEVGANSDDIYRLEVDADTEDTIRNLDPYAGSVWRNGKEAEGFYDY